MVLGRRGEVHYIVVLLGSTLSAYEAEQHSYECVWEAMYVSFCHPLRNNADDKQYH